MAGLDEIFNKLEGAHFALVGRVFEEQADLFGDLLLVGAQFIVKEEIEEFSALIDFVVVAHVEEEFEIVGEHSITDLLKCGWQLLIFLLNVTRSRHNYLPAHRLRFYSR